MKAELERDVAQLGFAHCAIMRPGMLAGERIEKRTGEKMALALTGVLHRLPGLGVLKPIQGFDVAKAMIVAAKTQWAKMKIYEMKELFALAEQWP